MTKDEKIAIVKMAGFVVDRTKREGDPWDWLHKPQNLESRHYKPTETEAYLDAFEYMVGDTTREYSRKPWSES